MNKMRMLASLLLVVAGMSTVVTGASLSTHKQEYISQDPDITSAMRNVMELFQAQNKKFFDDQEFDGPVEMLFSGFTAVIKTGQQQTTKDTAVAECAETSTARVDDQTSTSTDDDQTSTSADEDQTSTSADDDQTSTSADSDQTSTSADDGFSVVMVDVPSAIEDDNLVVQASSGVGYQRKGGSLYKFHVEGTDWQTAKSTCEREGAHLAIVNSEDEAQLLADMYLSKLRSAYYLNEMWVGVSDIAEEGDFVTVLGENLSSTGYEKWLDNQPDDYRLEDPLGEDCVVMRVSKVLNDVHCSANVAYICEIDVDGSDESQEVMLPRVTPNPRYFLRF